MPRHNTLSTPTYPHPFSQGLAGSTQTLWLFPQWKSGISAHRQGCRTTPPKYSSEDGSWHPDVHPVYPFLMLFSTTCFQVFLPQTGSLISFYVLPSIFRKGISMWQAPNFRDSACMLSILRFASRHRNLAHRSGSRMRQRPENFRICWSQMWRVWDARKSTNVSAFKQLKEDITAQGVVASTVVTC